ncbi:MAG: VOC family protein [Candidatus Eremiobacteraeota bacterium]|nr:VOC family protein [Candidatus Eremiobacteraeota bacterium]MBV8222437.1 VOC family protein [Candidatus Eremiobacteraeota bacterium]
MIPIKGLNHAVLTVADLDRAVRFYHDVFGFDEIARAGRKMAFMRAHGSKNHHDLGFLSLGRDAVQPPRNAVGLFHLAWEVPAIEDLANARAALVAAGALVGESDHGATKSVYGVDPDGHEFEIMWMVPREQWGEYEGQAPTGHLDLEAELRRHSASAKS